MMRHPAGDMSNRTMALNSQRPGSLASSTRPESRRHLVAIAIDGMTRFKKSRLSIVLLKGGMALAQVITLVVLSVLASSIPSPSNPDGPPQATPSEQCRHPELFQAWMGVNAFRLALCWAVSCWILVRTELARVRTEELEESEAAGIEETSGRTLLPQPSPSTTDPQDRSPIHDVHSFYPPTPGLSSTPNSRAPSSPQTPNTVFTPTMSNSSTSRLLDIFGQNGDFNEKRQNWMLSNLAHVEFAEFGMREEIHVEDEIELISPFHPSDEGTRRVSDPTKNVRNIRQLTEDCSRRDSQNDRMMNEADGFTMMMGRIARAIDVLAPWVSKSLGVLSACLFILGNILVFYPSVESPESCIHGAPLLWWGVMSVTAVGWFLIVQLGFVAFVIGIGGPAMLSLFRSLHILPPPQVPEPPRPRQSDPLIPSELSNLKLVCYIPDLTEIPSPSSEPPTSHTQHGLPSVTLVENISPTSDPCWIDQSRLPYSPHILRSHQTTCAICQEVFTVPEETGRTVLLRAVPLRLLGCGHVYHMACVDHWLTTGSGNCPTCNRSVRETMSSALSASLNSLHTFLRPV